MKSVKKYKIRDYQSLSYEEEKKQFQKLKNILNQRARELEKQGLTEYSDSYNELENGRFTYQKDDIKTKKGLNKEIGKVIKLLNKKDTTVTEAHKRKQYEDTHQYDYGDIRYLSTEEKERMIKEWTPIANARLKSLQAHDVKIGAIERAKHDLRNKENPRFSSKIKGIKPAELNYKLAILGDFLRSKSSTVKGLNAIYDRRFKSFQDKLKKRGIELKDSDRKKFESFLQSGLFSRISKYDDSDQVIDEFARSLEEAQNDENIIKMWEAYGTMRDNNKQVTLEQVREKKEYFMKKGMLLK